MAHSAHLRTARRRVEQGSRRLHQTCAYYQGTFPENLAELRPLLPGVTPALFEFSPETEVPHLGRFHPGDSYARQWSDLDGDFTTPVPDPGAHSLKKWWHCSHSFRGSPLGCPV